MSKKRSDKPVPQSLVESQSERFWRNVQKADGCWIWTGGRNARGYGKFYINCGGYLAHRVSYALARGSVPEDKCVMHKCDNPPCVNPDHLELATVRMNMHDMYAKRRACVGSRSHHAKLNEDQVLQIRIRHNSGEKTGDLAREFGVASSVIGMAVTGRKWKHVGGPISEKWTLGDPHKVTREDREKIKGLLIAGGSITDLAERYGVSASMICTIKRKLGLTRPKPHQQPKH